MRWFIFVILLIQFEVFSMEAAYEEQLSFRMKVIKMLCDSSQEPDLCPLWQRMAEAKEARDTSLEELDGMKERAKHIGLIQKWDDYMGLLCTEGLEDDPESVEDDPFVYFCNQRVQLIEAREMLSEAKTLVEIMKATAGVEGALDIEQAEHNVRVAEENYDVMQGILTGIICTETDEFPDAVVFCNFLKNASTIEQNYQANKVLLESMNAGRMDYKIRQLCKQSKYHLPCNKLK